MTVTRDLVEVASVDTNTAEWQKLPCPEIDTELDFIPLVIDPDTGMEVSKVVYKAGFTNPEHYHHCAHGMYVLEGTLFTHQGEYPAGSFVWFPEGGSMYHGATAERDCVFLFITNKPFDINYHAHS